MVKWYQQLPFVLHGCWSSPQGFSYKHSFNCIPALEVKVPNFNLNVLPENCFEGRMWPISTANLIFVAPYVFGEWTVCCISCWYSLKYKLFSALADKFLVNFMCLLRTLFLYRSSVVIMGNITQTFHMNVCCNDILNSLPHSPSFEFIASRVLLLPSFE